LKLPKVKLSLATGSRAGYHNAPVARIPASVGLTPRGPRHRTFQPAMATGPKLKGIRLTSMMAQTKPYAPKQAQWLPNPEKMAAKFAPTAQPKPL